MTYSGTMIADLMQIAELQDAIRKAEKELAEQLHRKTCQNEDCGENLNDHRGYDAACPHPKRFIAGNPLYIEGQYFVEPQESVTSPEPVYSVSEHAFEHSEHVMGRGNVNG